VTPHSFILKDGRKLAYREAGSGDALVLLHGWSMSSAVFAEAFPFFQDRFRVLAPDLRGHGDSDPGPGYSLDALAGDLSEWLQGLRLCDIRLLGWSLGGQIALTLAQNIPSHINRLILQSSTPKFAAGEDWEAGLPEGQIRAMARNLERNYRRTMGDFFSLQFAEEEMGKSRFWQVVDFAVRAGKLPAPAVALAALKTLADEDQRSMLSRLTLPVLVAHGDQDRITPVAAGRYMAGHLPAGEFAAIKECGHAPFLSRPTEAFSLWREFLL